MDEIAIKNTDEYLYHYTSLENLALILKNHTIRLNRMDKMDDLQEQKTQDIENFGQFFFVSSWTDDEVESIPMWKMYTNASTGVRIKLRKNPFKWKKTNVKELSKLLKTKIVDNEQNQEEVNTFLDICELINKKIATAQILSDSILYQIEYTKDKNLLEPKIYTPNEKGIELSFDTMGKYKNIHWGFQKEWRYLLNVIPFDYTGTLEEWYTKFFMLNKKIMLGKATMPISFIDLEIKEEFFERMEITSSPQMSAGNKIILDALVRKYNPSAIMKDSELLGLI